MANSPLFCALLTIVLFLTAPASAAGPSLFADLAESVMQNQLTDISCSQDAASGDVHVSGKVSNTGMDDGGPYPLTNVDLHIVSDLVPFLVNPDGTWATSGRFSARSIGDMGAGEVFEFDAVYAGVPSGVYGVEIAVTQFEHAAVETTCEVTVEESDPVADLVITKVGPEQVVVGEVLEFDILFLNDGPDAASVVVRDVLPDGFEYVSHRFVASPPDPCTLVIREDGTLECETVLAAKELHDLVITVRATREGEITNVATIHSEDTTDPNEDDNEDDAVVTVVEAADLYVQKVGPAGVELNVGDEFTYTITFGNKGPSAAGAAVQDEFPDGVEYLAHEITKEGASCTYMEREPDNRNRLSCTMDLAPEEEHTLTITVRATESGTFTNVAVISSSVEDPNEENNSDDVSTEVLAPLADLYIWKLGPLDAEVGVGEEFTYAITFGNNGPDAAPAAIQDQLPAGLEYVTHEIGIEPDPCSLNKVTLGDPPIAHDRLTCIVGLAPRDSHTLLLTVRATKPGTFTNLATIASEVVDPVEENNSDEEATEAIVREGELQIVKTADKMSAKVGDIVTFTIRLENTGDNTLKNVQITDVIRHWVWEYVSSDTPECVRAANSSVFAIIECTGLGDMQPGDSRVVKLSFRLIREIYEEGGNLAYASADNHKRVDSGINVLFDDTLVGISVIMLGGGRGGKQAASYDIYVDSTEIAELLAPAVAVVDSFRLKDISPTIHLVASGSEDLEDAVFADTLEFYTGDVAGSDFYLSDSYALIFAGSEEEIELLLHRDARWEAEDGARAELLVVHAAPDLPSVRLRLLSDTHDHTPLETLTEELAYMEASGYHSLAAAAHNVEISDAATGAQLDVFRLDLTAEVGKVFTVGLLADGSGAPALVAMDVEGTQLNGEVVTSADGDPTLPLDYTLSNNYPNPFNPSTSIQYAVPEQTAVRLDVFDALGRMVRTLVDAQQAPGTYTVTWDGRDASGRTAASGLYVYRITAGSFRAERSMVLLK